MLCPVCLFDVGTPSQVIPRHRDSYGSFCPMSGEPAYVWDERDTRAAVRGRSGDICEVCDKARATEMHHRISRGVGGTWCPANILHLCHRCHRQATDHPAWAYSMGISLKRDQDPEEVPVIINRLLVLSNDVAPPRRNRR